MSQTFSSRMAFAPLLENLRRSGGDLSRVIKVCRLGDLDRIDRGRRYKFVVTADGNFVIAPLPADAPSNPYVHAILAGGGPVCSAGGLVVERNDRGLVKVVLDQDSKAYCPTFASLAEPTRVLSELGLPVDAIERRDRPPDCVQPSADQGA